MERRENANERRENFVEPLNCPTQAKIGLEGLHNPLNVSNGFTYFF